MGPTKNALHVSHPSRLSPIQASTINQSMVVVAIAIISGDTDSQLQYSPFAFVLCNNISGIFKLICFGCAACATEIIRLVNSSSWK